MKYNKLYGFTAGGKDLFACVTFANLATKNRIANLWYKTIGNGSLTKKYIKRILSN
jgi:hypothetical protein